MKPVKFLFTAVFTLFFCSIFAQHNSLTVLGGLNASKMSVKFGNSTADIEDTYKMKPTFHAGVLYDYVLNKDRIKEISIETGLIFDAKGYKQEQSNIGVAQENVLSAYYADIPVYFKYAKKLRSRDKIYVGAGPYVGVGIFGSLDNSYSGEGLEGGSSESIQWGTDPSVDDMKRLDYGVTAKIGYFSYGGLNISAAYDLGLPNVSAAENPEYKHRVFKISVGYTFVFED